MGIIVFKPKYRTEECLKEIKECFDSNWTGVGYKTIEFENAWNDYTGFKYSHFLNSCTAALHLAIQSLKIKYEWKDRDEILTSPITFVSTNHAILYNNMKPVFVDVDGGVCLDPIDLEKKITKNTKAILFVAFGGSSGQYNKIKEIANKHDLKLIVDNAHAAGTRVNGKTFGLDADVVCYSFHSVKNLPTADGGMLSTNDEEIDGLVRKLSWLGIDKDTYKRSNQGDSIYNWKYNVEYVGYKYHGNSIMAAIGLVQLKYLDHDNAYRRQLAKWYTERLSKMSIIPIPEDCESSRHLFCVKILDRDAMVDKLKKNGVAPGVHYRNNLEYKMYNDQIDKCPHAKIFSKCIISLPMHLEITKKDVDRICDVILG